MINAKFELLDELAEAGSDLLCAEITYREGYGVIDEDEAFSLDRGYSSDELNLFLDRLDFDYDNGYGLQMLFGTLWFDDGTWSTRDEYDGSEWWHHHVCPRLPAIKRKPAITDLQTPATGLIG